ncbi:Rho GTPase activating protein [Coemansia sp. Benny D115]|nr:Rho GTPase activating protein [Coemansia sp. Benny D115]
MSYVDGPMPAENDSGEFFEHDEQDIIHIIQERDAYKQETEKLRKIIERQRFIIKSLQDQLSRKQGSSASNTPSLQNSDFSPDPLDTPAMDLIKRTLVVETHATPDTRPPAQDPPANRCASNALGLSSLSVAAPRKPSGSGGASAQAVGSRRNMAQNLAAGTGPGALAASNIPVDQQPMGGAALRPWVKSTRLSEIYADYSARHNSVSPMFKMPPGGNAGWIPGATDEDQHQRNRSASGSSFTESLKASIRRTEWPNEWNGAPEDQPEPNGYVSDQSAGHRQGSFGSRSIAENTPPLREVADEPEQPKHDSAFGSRSLEIRQQTTGQRNPDEGASVVAAPLNNGIPAGSRPSMHRASSSMDRSSINAPSTPLPAVPMANDPLEPSALPSVSENNVVPIHEEPGEDEPWKTSELESYEYDGPISATDTPATYSPPQMPLQQVPQIQQQFAIQQQQQYLPQQPQQQFNMQQQFALQKQQSLQQLSMHQQAPPHQLQHSQVHRQMSRQMEPSKGQGGSPSFGPSAVPVAAGPINDVPQDVSRRPSNHQIVSPHDFNDAVYRQPALSSLDNIDVQIKDSRIKIDERGKEVNVYMIDVVFRKEVSGLSLHEMIVDSQQPAIVVWTVEKRYSDFLYLHTNLRQAMGRERVGDKLERLPEKEIFRANAPAKSDKRKQWFEKYLKRAITLPLRDQSALLHFLSTDRTMEAERAMPILLGHKEGFLVKKGKNFGGWKRRYYVCKSNRPVLEYSDSPGGSINGTINLVGAVVKTGKARGEESSTGRPRTASRDSDMFRHAFLIEERPKREGKEPIAHPLWAESDRERDEWVMALRYVIVREAEGAERAMHEVTRYVNYTKRKEAVPMIQQIQTAITHEQGARRSIEYQRRREEQRNSGSPLSNQAWPGNAARSQPGPAQLSYADVQGGPLDDMSRERSLSYASLQGGDGDLVPPQLPVAARANTMNTASPSRSPPVLAATMSTSFTGIPGESLSRQADRMSVHYVPSEISTIESSIYSSYNGEGIARANDVSSRSIDGRNSYASVTDSPPVAEQVIEQNVQAQAQDRSPAVRFVDSPTISTPQQQHVPQQQQQQIQIQQQLPQQQVQYAPANAGPKPPFTKNALGRIVHEEEVAPDLPADTPLVTDDILGVGRKEAGDAQEAAGGRGGGGGRSREEKKRGRITFMWGKRRPAENDYPVPEVASPTTNPYGAMNSANDVPAVPGPRRLRRGSTSNDVRGAMGRTVFKGPVFGLPLERVVEQTKIREHYHLPAVVYRCIEFLDAKKAYMEEGIYRQSGGSTAQSQLRKEFNTNRDYNMLKLSKQPDVHAVASLLKAFLRELPENVLTTRLHPEFVRVADLNDRGDRVHELGRLVSEMPLANYTLLRALTAHLIRIVQKAEINKMTLRNIGIVFSPSLGIPVNVFSLLMVEFEYIFWVNDRGAPEPRSLAATEVAPALEAPSGWQHKPHAADAPLSISVPTGINRLQDDDRLHSAGSYAGADTLSLASDAPAHPPRTLDTRAPPQPSSMLRNVSSRPELGSSNTKGYMPVLNSQNRPQNPHAGPASNSPWVGSAQPEFGNPEANELRQDLSRYPGISSNASTPRSMTPQQQQQQQYRVQQPQPMMASPYEQRAGSNGMQRPSGRSNRNSMQYNVGAPRELIFQETAIAVPAKIIESEYEEDYDDDDDPNNSGEMIAQPVSYSQRSTNMLSHHQQR